MDFTNKKTGTYCEWLRDPAPPSSDGFSTQTKSMGILPIYQLALRISLAHPQ